jgi:hypothetical protein
MSTVIAIGLAVSLVIAILTGHLIRARRELEEEKSMHSLTTRRLLIARIGLDDLLRDMRDRHTPVCSIHNYGPKFPYPCDCWDGCIDILAHGHYGSRV